LHRVLFPETPPHIAMLLGFSANIFPYEYARLHEHMFVGTR